MSCYKILRAPGTRGTWVWLESKIEVIDEIEEADEIVTFCECEFESSFILCRLWVLIYIFRIIFAKGHAHYALISPT